MISLTADLNGIATSVRVSEGVHGPGIGVHITYIVREQTFLAGVGDSATEARKTPTKGVELAHAVDEGPPADQRTSEKSSAAPASLDATEATPDSSDPPTAAKTLSNQSFDLWKAEATQGTQESGGEGAATTLKAPDGSTILSFNPDWLREAGEPSLALTKRPTDNNPSTKPVPGPPLDLLPQIPGRIPIPTRNPRESSPDNPDTKTPQPRTDNPPLPLKNPLKVKNGIPVIPESPDKKEIPKVPAVEASFLPARTPPKPGQPTVIVLDDYRNSNMIVNEGKGFSHGELSARMAEENGFNVTRMQIGRFEGGVYDLPNSLAKLSKAIDDGTIKAGKGDIVNLSFDLAKTFSEASRMLGIEVTPENLREKREEILAIMREKSVDRVNTPKEAREFMRSVLAVDEGVKKLQERGLVVVAAGGNAGKNSFNLGFLSADKHYSAQTTDGKIASYSANNSLTTPGLGEVNIYSLPLNPFDSTPFSQQKGTYRVGGTNIYLPSEEFAGNFTPATSNPDVLRKLLFEQDTTGGDIRGFTRDYKTPPAISRFEGTAFKPLDAKALGLPFRASEMPDFDPKSWILGTNVLSVRGTSFVNIFKLKELQRPR